MRKHRKDQVLRGFNRLRALKNRGCQSGENDNIASRLLALHRLGARECNMTVRSFMGQLTAGSIKLHTTPKSNTPTKWAISIFDSMSQFSSIGRI